MKSPEGQNLSRTASTRHIAPIFQERLIDGFYPLVLDFLYYRRCIIATIALPRLSCRKGDSVEFKVGQKVIYPSHGIAIVEQIESRQIDGENTEFYLLRVQANNSTVMVPTSNASCVGVRRLIGSRQCDEVLKFLSDDFDSPSSDWKDRFKGFSEAIRSGDLFAVADVLKTLTYLNQNKPLSFREKQMLERARYLIVSEIAVVSRKTEIAVGSKVDEAIVDACSRHNVIV